MEFTKTILDALKHWVNGKISNIEKALEGKQPSGDYALKSEIPSLEGIATEEYVDNALAEFVPGEGGASVQSDYEQNDSEAADYIKNRPFYMGDLVETEIADINALLTENDRSWFLIDETKNLWVADAPISVLATEVGKQYVVVINGDKYTSVATLENMGMDAIAFGDWDAYVSMMTGGDPSGFTYVVACVPAQNIASIVYKGAEAPAEFKIYGVDQEIVKIDPKYLPEGGVGYTSAGGMETILEETAEVSGDELYVKLSTDLSFIEGEKYFVTFNGELYECIAWSGVIGEVPVTCIGNGNILEIEGEYNDEPFAFNSVYGECYLYVTEAGVYTVRIEVSSETIHKIDPKYLPEHVKSNWNENDPAAEGYIENRPFYEGFVAGDILFEETFEDFNSGELSEPVAFIEGETYFVTINEEQYECVAWSDDTINAMFREQVVGIGNTASEGIANKGSNNEPFYLMYAGGATIFGMEDQGTYTLKIQSATMAVAKKIDKKFLPDDVGGINIKTATEGDLIKVKEVDDTGKPTDYEAVSALNTLGFIDPKTGWEYVGYIYDGSWITCRKPETIEVVQMPDKTSYMVGEPFDPTGMVIVATYSDGATSEITNYSYPNLIELDFKIFCIDGAQYLNIDLSIFKSFQSIEVTQMPNKTSYFYGETFDPTGMVIIGTYENGDTEEITEYTYSEVTSEDFEIYCVDCDMTVVIKLSVAPEILRDFEVQSEGNDYYITGWRGTLNGQPSTEIIIPDTDEYNIIL